MLSDSDNKKSNISRQKFAELMQSVQNAGLDRSRKETSSRSAVRRAFVNCYNAIRHLGGVQNAVQRVSFYVGDRGLISTCRAIHQRLKYPLQNDLGLSEPKKSNALLKTDAFEYRSKQDYRNLYQDYLSSRKVERKIAVFRAVTGQYDHLLEYQHYLNNADYFSFTDEPTAVAAINLPIPYFDVSPTRSARYVKLHPHMLFPHHDVAIWHDGNVMIRGDITPFIDAVLTSKMPLGTFLHPRRDNIYDEARACIEVGKDDSNTIIRQLKRYSEEGFFSDQLVESNFVVYNLKHPDLRDLLAQWWAELDQSSLRDQLSFNHAVEVAGTSFLPLAERPVCARNHPSFAFFANHGDHNQYAHTDNVSGGVPPTFDLDARPVKLMTNSKLDVLVCVHNALDDVKACLKSVVRTGEGLVDKIIVVDDGSEFETQHWLESFAANNDQVVLARNNKASGYTKAINKAISLSHAETMLLLNSDTILGAGAMQKMLTCMEAREGCGIVGPLSNAASSQSLPSGLSAGDQTAVNPLPDGHSVNDMDSWCAENARDLQSPGVPFVHGFCMCVKREVFNQIGYFDEMSFPYGYGEENDFCIRTSDQGFRLNIAIDAFVFHAKSKSYLDDKRRKKLMSAGDLKLRDLHGTERVNRLVQSMERNPTLAKMRERSLELYR